MDWDFGVVSNRLGTASSKWDYMDKWFGGKDVLPMWVADMDFVSPKPVMEAMKKRIEHGVFGYTVTEEGYYASIIRWLQTRHDWNVEKDAIAYSPGVVFSLAMAVSVFSDVGDKIVIQSPVYPPFRQVIEGNGRRVVHNHLRVENNRFTMDFDDLAEKLKDATILILCNPHNPVGRVWTKEELTRLGELCLENGVLVVSDEIHCDLVYEGHRHVPFASLSEAFAQSSITCIAPTKTFNLAGLHISNVVIPNSSLRRRFKHALGRMHAGSMNLLSGVALEAAYNEGGPWLDALLQYLQQNRDFMTDFVAARIPEMTVNSPEGTYLAWLNCTGLGMAEKELESFFLKEARVALNSGYTFGPGGEGFMRLNFGCPQSLLEEGLTRIEKAVRGRV